MRLLTGLVIFFFIGCASAPTYRVALLGESRGSIFDDVLSGKKDGGAADRIEACRRSAIVANGSEYIVLAVLSDPRPLRGARLSGRFDGFGSRSVHNTSDNSESNVDLKYHASSYEDAKESLRAAGCAWKE